jgi:hypothetical protein
LPSTPPTSARKSRSGTSLSQERRHDEATVVMRRARELEPLNALVHAMSSQMAFQGR